TGGYVALADAVNWLRRNGAISANPITGQVASVSVGVYQQTVILDLDYLEDSTAETDMNVVMNEDQQFIEVQGTAERGTFSFEQMQQMTEYASKGIQELASLQSQVLAD
ncbi:MAG: ribonuclease PH, partial [Gammaproteobacteria bacterium]|nr:ribonuclease PH [Gammaproteobacteria bacterium]